MTPERITELAQEATDCIEHCDLTAEEIEDYLKDFLAEVVNEAIGQPKKKVTRARKR